jgi:hypothetical protein
MDRAAYSLRGLDDFLRLDQECARLLEEFARWLGTPAGGSLPAGRAGVLAQAADRYLRDFVVDIKETGPDDEDPSLVRQYLGNWYVIHTLSPNHEEIDRIALALRSLYAFLEERQIAAPGTARAVARILQAPDFFHRRLEDFWELTPETIPAWRAVDEYRRSAQ